MKRSKKDEELIRSLRADLKEKNALLLAYKKSVRRLVRDLKNDTEIMCNLLRVINELVKEE